MIDQKGRTWSNPPSDDPTGSFSCRTTDDIESAEEMLTETGTPTRIV